MDAWDETEKDMHPSEGMASDGQAGSNARRRQRFHCGVATNRTRPPLGLAALQLIDASA